jgi:peptidyl-tRNA hydrolase, PTH1 family
MLIIALQNVGEKYEKTRHNAGAIVLRSYIGSVKKEGATDFELDKFTNSFICKLETPQGPSLRLYLPNTFMNLSGESVVKILKKEIEKVANLNRQNSTDLKLEKFFVFFDDVTIPVGEYKISVGEGASSHNGIRSIVENIAKLGLTKDSFVRVRIGVGKMLEKSETVNGLDVKTKYLYKPEPEKLADFVLSNLSESEILQIEKLGEKIIENIKENRY